MDYLSKWSKYRVGEALFINQNRHRFSRDVFIKHVADNHPSSILEIGAGEMIEAKRIFELPVNCQYTVADISDSFLEYCKTYSNVNCVKTEMHATPFADKEFSLVYLSGVIEHTPDLVGTIQELSRISNSFFITLFKWETKTGSLKEQYRKKGKYFSTAFNIYDLFDLISQFGCIKSKLISMNKDKKCVTFEEYIHQNPHTDLHRGENVLSLIGDWYENTDCS